MSDFLMVILAIATFGFGAIVSGGVLTVFVCVGLIPRFAQETNTANRLITYENAVILGTIAGCVVTVFFDDLIKCGGLGSGAGNVVLAFLGFFAGIFEGCVALAIAEMLDSIPIFTKRIGFKKGLTLLVCAIGIGKALGSFLYFYFGF